MTDPVLVLSGGSRGIGRSIVVEAARRGYRVVFCGRSRSTEMDETVALATELCGAGRVFGVAADVRDEDAVDSLFDEALDRFDQVDVVVHNAGVNRDGLLVNTEVEAFDEVMATNLTGAFLLARRGISEFLAQGTGGRIVQVGSISQQGATSQSVYAASKGALLGLTKSIAKEVGHLGITANVVVTGLIDAGMSDQLPVELRTMMTERSSLRRAGQPNEVASCVLWLASQQASYVNGAELHCTGGLAEVQW